MPYDFAIRRGDLKHWVTLDRLVQRPDGEGGFEDVSVPLDPPRVRAKIEPATQTNMERVTANTTVVAVATHLVTMDYHPGVTIQTRVTYERGRVLNVRSIVNVLELDRELVLACAEVL